MFFLVLFFPPPLTHAVQEEDIKQEGQCSRIDPKETDSMGDVVTAVVPSPDPTKIFVSCGKKIYIFNAHPQSIVPVAQEERNPYLPLGMVFGAVASLR